MNELLYPMIFKRKSFHTFKGKQSLSQSEMQEIQEQLTRLKPLIADIPIAWKIVPTSETTCRRGEYCILIYSEKKDFYLYNVGYMLEQLDLWLASKNIGACWNGMAKTKETKYQGLDYVIMLTIEKVDEKEFRKDYTKAKRKKVEDMWHGHVLSEVASVARYAPSACNKQPWLVKATENKLDLYRVQGKRGIIPASKLSYYSKIDVGIFMFFMELCLNHEEIPYRLEMQSDGNEEKENLVATYYLQGNENK